MTDETPRSPSRRHLLQVAAGTAAGAGLGGLARAGEGVPASPPRPKDASSMIGVPFEKHDRVRFGLIGCGGRGRSLLRNMLGVEGVEVKAICDLVPEKVERAQAMIEKAGQARAEGYSKGEKDFENLCARDDLDLVFVATPWNWHVRMAVAAMEGGAHVGVEVPAASTLEGCWRLVDASERTRRHCMMLENACYGWDELFVLNMVRAGELGVLTHAECAYIHDLRSLLFADRGEGLWRRFEHWRRNGNLYPTHGLGPVARYLDINRGDRFEFMVSMSSPSVGLQAYRDRTLEAGDPRRMETYDCGDMNTSLIKTAGGRSIVLQHDVISPRPYDRINLLSGTKGTFRSYPSRLFLDGQEEHEWQAVNPEERKPGGVEDRFEHALWKKLGETARGGGHGGMDYIMCWRLIECFREGLAPDMDVYDGASWSAPAPLSELSVAQRSAPLSFPDFTRGSWSEKRT
ncbi:MAG: Gfo/Idh/MocA family oxidoreductase [Acidobacteria bacterium]|nr:Gfo/Idh/MocA family oxidoreductase [Acidobacteriota bacterium]